MERASSDPMPTSIKFESLKGQLLLDSGQLTGSWFHRTVVLICHHDREGAFGLVLNRRTEMPMEEVVNETLPDTLKKLPLHLGGPVQPEALSFLHSDALILNANVMPNLEKSHDLAELVELASNFSPACKLRIFGGYSGWGAGQLDSEMARHSWITHPASIDLVFDEEGLTLWRRVLLSKGPKFRLLAELPDDLSLN